MRRIVFYFIMLVIVSCGQHSVNHEVLNEGKELSGKVDWDSIAGTYLMDKKFIEDLGVSEKVNFYLVINRDSTYYVNRYMDDDTIKVINHIYKNQIMATYFYNENSKIIDKDSIQYYGFIDNPNQRYKLNLYKYNSSDKLFIMVLYFPDLSYDPNALDDTAYRLKYDKISDEPMNLEELEKTIQ